MRKTILILSLVLHSLFSFGQCPTPGGLFTTNITFSTALANWTPVSGVDHYKIHYRVFGSSTWGNLGNIGMNDSTRNLPLLQQSTTYEWEIIAFCDSTNQLGSGWSVSDTFTTIAFVASPFNPVVINTITNLQCNTHTELSLRVSQTANEPDIDSSVITSDGGYFDINSMAVGDSIGFAIMTTNTQTIYGLLKVGILSGPNYAIINTMDSGGVLIGEFLIANTNGGIKVSSESPNDGNNYTSGYISELHFTNHFVTPPVAGPLNFYADIVSELNDQIYDTSTFVISCGNTSITESHDAKQLIHIYDILGRSNQLKPNQIFIYYYSDGTIEKKLIRKK
ncbi:fibronectin type III domain-containing protein [Flavobacteriales bacterium]|nr:fibronectin type III domain-containing protein [Flavobacteriales bacterium]